MADIGYCVQFQFNKFQFANKIVIGLLSEMTTTPKSNKLHNYPTFTGILVAKDGITRYEKGRCVVEKDAKYIIKATDQVNIKHYSSGNSSSFGRIEFLLNNSVMWRLWDIDNPKSYFLNVGFMGIGDSVAFQQRKLSDPHIGYDDNDSDDDTHIHDDSDDDIDITPRRYGGAFGRRTPRMSVGLRVHTKSYARRGFK